MKSPYVVGLCIGLALGLLVVIRQCSVVGQQPYKGTALHNTGSPNHREEYDYNSLEEKVDRTRPVRFIPYPHKSLPNGDDAMCAWSIPDADEAAALLGQYSSAPDAIQSAALREGVCIPRHKNVTSLREGCAVRLFSSAEATSCLSQSSGAGGPMVVIAGDSYNKQLTIGLADVLLGDPSNFEIRNAQQRNAVLLQRIREVNEIHRAAPSFPRVRYVCDDKCYGASMPFGEKCSRCINRILAERNPDAVAVVGAGSHILRSTGQLEPALEQIESFLLKARRVIFNSMPSYQTDKIPPQYRNATHHGSDAIELYFQTLERVAPRAEHGHPFIDYFQLTRSCYMENCSYDGGHRARYVNRWKAQLLLNTLCEVVPEGSEDAM